MAGTTRVAELKGLGDLAPDELAGTGVTAAHETCDLGGDAGKTLTLDKFGGRRFGLALGVSCGGIDTCEG